MGKKEGTDPSRRTRSRCDWYVHGGDRDHDHASFLCCPIDREILVCQQWPAGGRDKIPMHHYSSGLQDLLSVKIRKTALGSNELTRASMNTGAERASFDHKSEKLGRSATGGFMQKAIFRHQSSMQSTLVLTCSRNRTAHDQGLAKI